jgi:gamma-glutamylaminecyclotransferase
MESNTDNNQPDLNLSNPTVKQSPSVINVFVYGSLRKGLYNYNSYLSKCEQIGTFRISGFKLYELCSSYPGAVYTGSEDDELTVELFKINRSKLKELDRLEGHPTFYKRVKITVGDFDNNSEDEPISGWIYCIPEASVKTSDLIESGDWLDRVSQKS